MLISICVDKESAKKNEDKLMRMLKDLADSVNSANNGVSAGEPYRSPDADRANTVRYSIIINTEDETPANTLFGDALQAKAETTPLCTKKWKSLLEWNFRPICP